MTDRKNTIWREHLTYEERQVILQEPQKDYCRAFKNNECLVEKIFGRDKKPEACKKYLCEKLNKKGGK